MTGLVRILLSAMCMPALVYPVRSVLCIVQNLSFDEAESSIKVFVCKYSNLFSIKIILCEVF